MARGLMTSGSRLSRSGGAGAGMQLYFFDISWDGETIADEDGTGHFDDGSAIYYARVVANRLARCGRYESVRVNVRDAGGRLLTIVVPGCCLPAAAHRARIRTIVENDLARQRLAAAA